MKVVHSICAFSSAGRLRVRVGPESGLGQPRCQASGHVRPAQQYRRARRWPGGVRRYEEQALPERRSQDREGRHRRHASRLLAHQGARRAVQVSRMGGPPWRGHGGAGGLCRPAHHVVERAGRSPLGAPDSAIRRTVARAAVRHAGACVQNRLSGDPRRRRAGQDRPTGQHRRAPDRAQVLQGGYRRQSARARVRQRDVRQNSYRRPRRSSRRTISSGCSRTAALGWPEDTRIGWIGGRRTESGPAGRRATTRRCR